MSVVILTPALFQHVVPKIVIPWPEEVIRKPEFSGMLWQYADISELHSLDPLQLLTIQASKLDKN